jgi:hypothetical protein
VFLSLSTFGQSNKEIAGVYIRKAEANYSKLEIDEADKNYAKQYFILVKNRKAETYTQLLDLYVTIEEELEKVTLEKEKLEQARFAREKELKRIDSLKKVWQNKSDALTLQFKSIQAFNKHGVSVFQKDYFFGVMNDLGTVLV